MSIANFPTTRYLLSGGNKLSQGSRHVPALDSSCPTSSMASRWACSSCWGLPRSRSAVKFWSIQGARWWRASRGKWSPASTEDQIRAMLGRAVLGYHSVLMICCFYSGRAKTKTCNYPAPPTPSPPSPPPRPGAEESCEH